MAQNGVKILYQVAWYHTKWYASAQSSIRKVLPKIYLITQSSMTLRRMVYHCDNAGSGMLSQEWQGIA